MKLFFEKYHGTGNDFIIIDNRKYFLKKPSKNLIYSLCNRRYGIGADGVILLQDHTDFDFEMIYFNADGKEGSMCGNGARCVVDFAKKKGIIKNKTEFFAYDGIHQAVHNNEVIGLKMNPVNKIEKTGTNYFLDTGSPHYVIFVKSLSDMDIVKGGRKIRYNIRFKKKGTNVNFVETTTGGIKVRTYERGVETETLSCGTGAVAAAICYSHKNQNSVNNVNVLTTGGKLKVKLEYSSGIYKNIWLYGPAVFVFEGAINI